MADARLIVRGARVLLRLALPIWAHDAARGDLDEEHARIARERGAAAARRWYARAAISLSVRYLLERRHRQPASSSPFRKASMHTHVMGIARDLRLVARQAAARPGFWFAATATLGLSIGFNAAIFSLANAVLFKPLANHEPDRVVRLYAQPTGRAASPGFSYPDYRTLTDSGLEVLSDVAAVHLGTLVMRDRDGSAQLLAEIASGSYFKLLGVPMIAGRTLEPTDDMRTADPAVVLSEHYWRNALGADPTILGRSVLLSGRPFTVVGVVSRRFGGSFVGGGVDAWLPLEAGLPFLGAGSATDGLRRPLQLLARLAPGASIDHASAALGAAAPEISRLRQEPGGVRLEAVPGTLLHGRFRRMAALFLSLLTAMVALVLLIAASNVANLQLARTLGRRRELAIRMSLGAGRARIIQQLIAESLVLAAGGLAVALAITFWVERAFRSFEILPGFELRLDLAPDVRVFTATAVAALLAGLLATLAPALHATRGNLVPFLREGGSSLGGRRTARVRATLVVVQVAVAVVVCVAAGLLTRSGRAAAAIDLGFDRTGILATDIDLDPHGYTQPRGEAFYRALLAGVAEVAGVTHAAIASRAPLDSSTPGLRLLRDGETGMAAQGAVGVEASYYVVSPGYFETVGVPLLAGRRLAETDRAGGPQTAIANEILVRAMWPGSTVPEAVGRRVRVAPGASDVTGEIEIVGVARNAKYRTVGEADQPHLYLPSTQHYSASMALLVRSRLEPVPSQGVQAAIAVLDPAVQGFFTRTLDEHTRVALLPARFASRVATVVGLVSALLGALGLHALISCVVAERRREFGLRMALGATARGVSAEVVRHTLTLALAGCAIGVVAGLAGARVLGALLYGVSPSDPLVYAAVTACAVVTAAASAWLPALRASRIDPSVALRQ